MANSTDAKEALPTTRRDHLLSIEKKVQKQWSDAHIWECDADDAASRSPDDKYLATFPYPYMNGSLHLGHGFTLAKVDFQCQYQRLKGKKVLYPFGFHCIAGDALIATPSGLSHRLDTLVTHSTENKTLAFHNDGIVVSSINAFAHQGVKECIQLTLIDGRTLTCTADHQCLVKRDDTLQWIAAEDIGVNSDDAVVCGPLMCEDVIGTDEAGWSLHGICDMGSMSNRSRALAFARVLGLLNTERSMWSRTSEAAICVDHQLDVDSLRADIELIAGESHDATLISSPHSDIDNDTWYRVPLPGALLSLIKSLPGQVIGDMDQTPSWPEFLSSAELPLSFLREFVAGWLGGCGHAPHVKNGNVIRHAIIFNGSCKPEFADAMLSHMQEFCAWLERLGVEGCVASISKTDNPRVKYSLTLTEKTGSSQFLRCVGFRHCVHMSMRMSAAHSYIQMRELHLVQRQSIADRALLYSMQGLSLAASCSLAVIDVQESETVIHPSVLSFKPSDLVKVKKGQPLRPAPGFPSVIQFLEQIGADSWFKVSRIRERVCRTSKNPSMQLPLTLFRIINTRSVPPRAVFDLQVPHGDSFTANGIIVHNCTGMPIAASADKIKREIELYGNPPKFPEGDEAQGDSNDDAHRDADHLRDAEREREQTFGLKEEKPEDDGTAEEPEITPAEMATAEGAEQAAAKIEKKRKVKAKLAKKKSKQVYQWNILKEMGVPESELALFASPYHWLSYFPPLAIQDLSAFGLSTDWRRSFITTHVNPYYDAFIRWQFNTLKKKDKVAFGARLSVFSPIDNQSCADHDRAEGEGVGITDYTLVKLELQQPYPATLTRILSTIKTDPVTRPMPPVFLPAATLRPETMYGQTNVFLLPDGDYGVFDINDTNIFICSAKSALNMSYQQITRHRGNPEKIGMIKGQELMGCAVKAPLAKYDHIYVLPLTTIKMDKGTGVVTSVPSDAPDDYAALMDLKKKPAFREKFHIKAEHVLPFDVVPIIEIPGLGTQAAVDLCIAENVVSQNDRVKLELIKEKTYKEGFAKGIMLVGQYKGMKVSEAKPRIKADLIAAGFGIAYSEPESRVVSRSGNECVVAYSDQWYLKYGGADWCATVTEYVENKLQTYNPIAKKDFLFVLGWLHEWACSRSYGLGTFLPWDQQYVIESLSDSTIYMAYYTIAHLLQGGVPADNVNGQQTGPAAIAHSQLTDEVFDYIFFHSAPYPSSTDIPKAVLDKLRNEFEYWYPMNLRVSGKDLIGNHLTFCLYNHAAIWEQHPQLWPQSFFANGHITIDAKKMSKSEGTFITLKDAVAEYSADATRFALADSGDGLEDANFEKASANAAILKLTRELTWAESVLKEQHTLRTGGKDSLLFQDGVFLNEMNSSIVAAQHHYEQLQYRLALRAAFHDLIGVRDAYRFQLDTTPMHADVVQRYFEVSLLLIAPICPHYAQHTWEVTGLAQKHNARFIAQARWPIADPVDMLLNRQVAYLKETNSSLRRTYTEQIARLNKMKTKQAKDLKQVQQQVDTSQLSHLVIVTANAYPPSQAAVIGHLTRLYSQSRPELPARKDVIDVLKQHYSQDKKQMEAVTKFATGVLADLAERGEAALELEMPFDERTLMTEQLAWVIREIPVNVQNVQVLTSNEMEQVVEMFAAAASRALPGRPAFHFYKKE